MTRAQEIRAERRMLAGFWKWAEGIDESKSLAHKEVETSGGRKRVEFLDRHVEECWLLWRAAWADALTSVRSRDLDEPQSKEAS